MQSKARTRVALAIVSIAFASMPQTTTTFKHRLESGEEVAVDLRWSFMGAAVQWFANVVHQNQAIARIGGRVQLAAGMELSAPSAVLVDARRELLRRSAELESRVAELHSAVIEAASIEMGPPIVDLELELSREAARGDVLWKEFFGEAETTAQGEEQTRQ
jgi:hypothetical protein